MMKLYIFLAVAVFFVIVLLVVALVLLGGATEDPDFKPAPARVTVVPKPPKPELSILYTAVRIEEGAKISRMMLEPRTVGVDQAPSDYVRDADIHLVAGRYAIRMMEAGAPVVSSSVSVRPPFTEINIPRGYRAVTIRVDATTGIEGFARPNSRVDVLWIHRKDRKETVSTLCRSVKVLSVGGSTEAERKRLGLGNSTTLTLQVTEVDAKKIELARTRGRLSLTLQSPSEPVDTTGGPDSITEDDLIPSKKSGVIRQERVDGVMYTYDAKTGRPMRYILKSGRWEVDRSPAN